MLRKEFRTLVNREYCEQNHEFDNQHDAHYWLGLVIEELGEAAQCLNDRKSPVPELVQVVALIEAWVEQINYESDKKRFADKIGREIEE